MLGRCAQRHILRWILIRTFLGVEVARAANRKVRFVAYRALLMFCVDKRHQLHGYAIVSRP